jgi:hypothetical protein
MGDLPWHEPLVGIEKKIPHRAPRLFTGPLLTERENQQQASRGGSAMPRAQAHDP